jgi:hypothetical protein
MTDENSTRVQSLVASSATSSLSSKRWTLALVDSTKRSGTRMLVSK